MEFAARAILRQANGVIVGLGASSVSSAAALALERGVPFKVFSSRESLGSEIPRWLESVRANALLVVGFPFRLPEEALNAPALGAFNVHPGLLPAYRGPAPAFWTIRESEPAGGVTVHRMAHAFDSGPIFSVREVPIGPEETRGEHIANLDPVVAASVMSLTEALATHGGGLQLAAQDESKARYWRRPTEEDVSIDWANMTAMSVHALVRAAFPSPGALTWLGPDPVRLLRVAVLPSGDVARPADAEGVGWIRLLDGLPAVGCGDGRSVRIDAVSTPLGTFSGADFVGAHGIGSDSRLGRPG